MFFGTRFGGLFTEDLHKLYLLWQCCYKFVCNQINILRVLQLTVLQRIKPPQRWFCINKGVQTVHNVVKETQHKTLKCSLPDAFLCLSFKTKIIDQRQHWSSPPSHAVGSEENFTLTINSCRHLRSCIWRFFSFLPRALISFNVDGVLYRDHFTHRLTCSENAFIL